MTELVEGQNYTAVKKFSGTSAKGDWEFVAISDKRGKNEIAIFTRNRPCGVEQNQKFNLKTIHSVKWGFKKDKNDRWQPHCSIEATIEPITSEFDTDITGAGDVNWSEMAAGDDPWADLADIPL